MITITKNETLKIRQKRLVIVILYYNELTIQDISNVLNISKGTVKSQLNRGATDQYLLIRTCHYKWYYL